MGLLFVHDHKFRYIEGKYYSIGGLSDEALNRYTKAFGKTIVIARVITEQQASDKYSEITNDNITILNGLNMSKKQMEDIVKESDYIISRMPSLFGLKVLRIAKKIKKKCLVELVACPWDSLWNHSLIGKLAAPYMTYQTKRQVASSSHVIYVTERFLQERYPSKGISVNCSNVALIESDEAVLERRLEKINQHKGKIIIGTVAALNVRYKGQQYIIEALGKLKKQGNINFEYHLVGSGDQSYLELMAQKNNVEDQVKFVGSLPHNKIFEWLEQIDLYAQPSRQEGLPRALIEAMSRGVPSIGAKTGGIPELLDYDCLFGNGNANIDEIIGILTSINEEYLKRMAIRNFEESKKYSKQLIEKRRNDFFELFKGIH